jgi:hypothetical protein
MNTTLTHKLCSSRSTVNIPYRRRRVKFARQPRFNGERISRAGRIDKRELHTGRAELVTSPAIKDGVYDQETIEISTNERSVIRHLGSPDEDHRRAKFALDSLNR